MPRLSDSMEEGTIVKWLVAQGDAVELGQPLVEIETDKATVTYEADESGVILALYVREGALVPVGAPIAVLGEAGDELITERSAGALATGAGADAGASVSVAPPITGAETSVSPGPPTAGAGATIPSPPVSARAKASPLARRLASERGVDLAALNGSGPGGRVIRADVERAVAGPNGGAAPAPATGSKGEVTRHELTRNQGTVARRMSESRATVPDIELRREVDMTATASARGQLRDKVDPVPSYNDFIIRAVALALRDFPRVNGAYRDSGFETYSRVNVGMAVAAPDALVVPTIFDADTKSIAEIAVLSRELAARVRDGRISPADVSGGTFTVTNLGMHGVDSFSPVINPPQAAILAVGSVRPRPIVDESGAVVARPTVLLTLACDHRIVYGADGAAFLARLADLLERPVLLFV